MSRPSSSSSRKATHTAKRNDIGVLIGAILIGVFFVFMVYMVDAKSWPYAVIGVLIGLAFMILRYGWQVCSGKRLPLWQQSLAAIPLRFAGYGTAGGRPLEAAKGDERAKSMLFIFLAVAVVIILGVTLLVVPR